jgi:serine/threonine-protein kinase
VAPGYTEIRVLGSGATGRVMLARHDASGRLVAIKYLAARLVGDYAFAERFRREAALMAYVRNPHVVEVYGLAIAADGRGVALVMEAVEGPTLRTLLKQGHGTPEAALALLRGSLLGLAAAHDRGVVHRDYKPDNVLVDARGESKLTDFGIASPAWAGTPAEGTPAYMAPEQWNGYPPAPASDMYSAAVVFYECLTGVRPFRSETLAELRAQHESASRHWTWSRPRFARYWNGACRSTRASATPTSAPSWPTSRPPPSPATAPPGANAVSGTWLMSPPG